MFQMCEIVSFLTAALVKPCMKYSSLIVIFDQLSGNSMNL